MKMLWCWRCKMEVPMLDDEEFKVAEELYRNGFGMDRQDSMKERFQPVLDYYNELTGWNATFANAVMHHCISMYGDPCGKCGKPYRTPQASFCAACGNRKPEL